jgi:hypothetical protein
MEFKEFKVSKAFKVSLAFKVHQVLKEFKAPLERTELLVQ